MCSCGDSYGKHGKLRVGRCAKLCPDSLLANWYCGDELRNQIFETQEPSDPAVPIPDSAGEEYNDEIPRRLVDYACRSRR